MPVYEYAIDVCLGSNRVLSMPLYVQLSEKASKYGDDPFTEEVNGCGPSGELEDVLRKKVSELERNMAIAIDADPDAFTDLLDYSFPIESVSATPVFKDIVPDYIYEWDREYVPTSDELLSRWDAFKKKLGVENLSFRDYYSDLMIAQNADVVMFGKFLATGFFSNSDINVLATLFSDLVDTQAANADQKMYVLEAIHENLDLFD